MNPIKAMWDKLLVLLKNDGRITVMRPLMEEHFIKFQNTLVPNGYNLRPGGNHSTHSVGTRRKIGEAHKGNKYNLGRPMSLENREKLRIRMTGNKICVGRHLSKETREKIREAKKGKKITPFTEAHRAAIGTANKRRFVSQSTRDKISISRKGKKRPPFSPEHRDKLKAAQIARRSRERLSKVGSNA